MIRAAHPRYLFTHCDHGWRAACVACGWRSAHYPTQAEAEAAAASHHLVTDLQRIARGRS